MDDKLYLYEISGEPGENLGYVISHDDQIKHILKDINDMSLQKSQKIIIERKGEVKVDKLTLERLFEEYKREKKLNPIN